METITVLIPSAGFAAIDLLEHLMSHPVAKYRLILTDLNPDMRSQKIANAFYASPATKSDDYLDFMLKLCSRENVNAILPGKAADAVFFSEHKSLFSNAGVSVIVPDSDSVKNAVDKALSFDILRKAGISVPDSREITTIDGFKDACRQLGYPQRPICIKPSKYPSESGRGFRILDPRVNVYKRMFWEQPADLYYVSVETVLEAMVREETFPPQLVMEYLPDDEYSVYCFCENGEALYTIPNRRISLYQMSTMEAVVEANPEVEMISRKICEIFNFDFCVNIQLKYAMDKKPKVVEINPRMAGTIMLPVMAGVDMVHYAIQKSLGRPYPRDARVKYGTRIKREFISRYYGE